MPTVTFRNELNDDKIGYPSYVPRATHRFTFDFSTNASNLLKNIASIGFVLQIMRFDTAHTLMNRYVPDMACLILLNSFKWKQDG